MRNTFRYENTSRYAGASAARTTNGASISAPVGGWDAISPISAMPPENAIELVNFFPQPGWVELRKGGLIHCDVGTGTAVDSVMGYMGQDTTKDRLIVASGGHLWDATTSTASSLASGYGSDRWQFTNFAGVSGSYLWACNGVDLPQYYDGTSITATAITVGAGSDSFDPHDIINVQVYNNRLWTVIKDSTQAVYLGLDSITGDGFVFDVGQQFINGGYLLAIGTFSTSGFNGPLDLICFISSQGDVAAYSITDPTVPEGISYKGRAEISQPVGNRCICKIGADLGIITLDGVLPLSQVLTYDKAALIGASITKNIRQAINDVMRTSKDNFGWQLHSYPRGTMAILNVPVIEGTEQQQYVMNTITGAWAQFEGQSANCWEVFLDKPYYGDNSGRVWEADASACDENEVMTASMRGAFNYYSERGRLKDWHTIRPNITIDQTFPVTPFIGLNVDFGTNAVLDPVIFGDTTSVALWDVAIWDHDLWPGELTSISWAGTSGLGYCASIRMTVSLTWEEAFALPKTLKINGFDMLYFLGDFI